MKKKFLAFAIIMFSIYSIILLIVVIQRYQLDYNSEGKYFDEINGVTYDEDIISTFVVSFFFALFVVLFSYWQYKKIK